MEASRLQERPIVSSLLIAVLAGILLQTSNIIEFQEIVAGVLVDQYVPVRLIDIGFRMTMGALLVFVAIPLLLGYLRRDGWQSGYRGLLRINMGPSPHKTMWATIWSVLAFVAVLVTFAIGAGVFDGDPSVLIADNNWLILLAALVPGIWEELAFRGVALSQLQPRFSPMAAVALSSIAFGLFHLSNYVNWDDSDSVIAGVVAATTLGLGWGYVVIKTQSILPAMVLHYVVDVVLYDELFIDPLAGDDSTSIVYLAIVVLYPLLTVLGTWLLFSRDDSLAPVSIRATLKGPR
jgi:membrane protease YdiL (CAAX protease family)